MEINEVTLLSCPSLAFTRHRVHPRSLAVVMDSSHLLRVGKPKRAADQPPPLIKCPRLKYRVGYHQQWTGRNGAESSVPGEVEPRNDVRVYSTSWTTVRHFYCSFAGRNNRDQLVYFFVGLNHQAYSHRYKWAFVEILNLDTYSVAYLMPRVTRCEHLYEPEICTSTNITVETIAAPDDAVIDPLGGDESTDDQLAPSSSHRANVTDMLRTVFTTPTPGALDETDIIYEAAVLTDSDLIATRALLTSKSDTGATKLIIKPMQDGEVARITPNVSTAATVRRGALAESDRNVKWDGDPELQNCEDYDAVLNNLLQPPGQSTGDVGHEKPYTLLWINERQYSLCYEMRGSPIEEYALPVRGLHGYRWAAWTQQTRPAIMLSQLESYRVTDVLTKFIPRVDRLLIESSKVATAGVEVIVKTLITAVGAYASSKPVPREINSFYVVDFKQSACVNMPGIWGFVTTDKWDAFSIRGPIIKPTGDGFLRRAHELLELENKYKPNRYSRVVIANATGHVSQIDHGEPSTWPPLSIDPRQFPTRRINKMRDHLERRQQSTRPLGDEAVITDVFASLIGESKTTSVSVMYCWPEGITVLSSYLPANQCLYVANTGQELNDDPDKEAPVNGIGRWTNNYFSYDFIAQT